MVTEVKRECFGEKRVTVTVTREIRRGESERAVRGDSRWDSGENKSDKLKVLI